MAFTAEEETDILRFLGYPDWQSLAQSVQLGYPAASQPLFLVRDSFKRMTHPAEQAIRAALCELRDIDCQLRDARKRLRASKVGEVVMNPDELPTLRGEWVYWQRRLADLLGVVPNPFSQLEWAGAGGGINSKVEG